MNLALHSRACSRRASLASPSAPLPWQHIQSVGTCVEEPRGRWRRAVLETPRLVCNPELYLIFRARLCERGTRTMSRRLINHSDTITRSAGLCIAAAAARANLPASMSGDVNKSHGSADPSIYLYVQAQKHLANTPMFTFHS